MSHHLFSFVNDGFVVDNNVQAPNMTTPAPPFQSYSVPTSPAATRSGKGQPITPQRQPPRHHHRHSQSSFKSPNTPSTPYTPLSLKSSDSAGSSSSAITTPDNVSFLAKKRLGTGRSPDIRNASADSVESKDRSLADLAQNWRARANQHGIKVASSGKGGLGDGSSFGDDEASDKTSSDVGNDSSMMSTDEALLPPPFLSYHRRSTSQSGVVARPRAVSHGSMQMLENRVPDGSPIASRNANSSLPLMSSPVRVRRALAPVGNLMSTPPPNRALSSELKLKGSLTEPAQPRRREPFAPVNTPSIEVHHGSTSMNLNLSYDASLDLFNINEHDYEYTNDIPNAQDLYDDESFSFDLQTRTANVFGYSSVGPTGLNASSNQPTSFADPFFEAPSGYGQHILNTISESAEHHFHTTAQPQLNLAYQTPNHYTPNEPMSLYPLPRRPFALAHAAPKPYRSFSAPVQLPSADPFMQPPAPAMNTANISPPNASPTDCSVCLASYPPSLAVLQPCAHPLCSACLTSALNIVGEKDMQCAVCNRQVSDFKLISIKKSPGDAQPVPRQPTLAASPRIVSSSFSGVPAFSPTCRDLDNPFDLGFDPSDIRASTPKLEHRINTNGLQSVVLRIDNVPWDITPRQITTWLQQPVQRVHVLLDSKGKTLSHAYVEVKDASIAGAILRGETAHPNAAGKKERGSVLGKGKRARGVTVTRSTQEELMGNLFPHWRGMSEGFKASPPSAIAGVPVSEGEINALRHLIQSPDSHFLKVPVLPFHSLISLLCKFPSDAETPPGVRDRLFDLARTGLEELYLRVEKMQKAGVDDGEHTMDLVHDLAKVVMNCKVFNSEQIRRFTDLLVHFAIPVPDIEEVPQTPSDHGSSPVALHTPSDQGDQPHQGASFADLAKEFGVEAHLVQALAQRLAALQ